MGANIKLVWISDVVRHGGNLRVECACGRRSVLDAEKVLRYYRCHGWPLALETIGQHVRCSRCKARYPHIRMTKEAPRGPRWGPLTEEHWKYLVKKLRG